jgi:hypothetical protein
MKSRIAVVLDRSGSMASVRKETIDGFNEFVNGLRSEPGECSLKLVQFNQKYQEVFDKPLSDVPLLTEETFVPGGNTALFDAIGGTVVSLGEDLKKMPEADRPQKVIVMILTDGMENASQEYTQDKIREMVTHQKEVYAWDFVFLGSNQDAVLTASKFGIHQQSAMTYGATGQSMQAVMSVATRYANTTRARGSAAFTEEERKKAK